jgi:predicted XRE-type DNA-binding protein
MEKKERVKVKRGGGNVFADIGMKSPKEALAKAELVRAIAQALRVHKLTQAELGALVGLHQSEVSKLLRGRTTGYSTDRLIEILTVLGHDVTIQVSKSAARKRGAITVETVGSAVYEKRDSYGTEGRKR